MICVKLVCWCLPKCSVCVYIYILNELLVHNIDADVEIDNLPMEIDDTQSPKTFFEHELYLGKTMKVQFSKRPFAQPFGVYFRLKDVKYIEREGYTFEEVCVKKAPTKGEHEYCAKSLGTLIGFAISKLGIGVIYCVCTRPFLARAGIGATATCVVCYPSTIVRDRFALTMLCNL